MAATAVAAVVEAGGGAPPHESRQPMQRAMQLKGQCHCSVVVDGHDQQPLLRGQTSGVQATWRGSSRAGTDDGSGSLAQTGMLTHQDGGQSGPYRACRRPILPHLLRTGQASRRAAVQGRPAWRGERAQRAVTAAGAAGRQLPVRPAVQPESAGAGSRCI